jgi:hypothetical protein
MTATAIDLRPFVADHEHSRFACTVKPQTFGGYTWATDGKILVRVPAVGPDTCRYDEQRNRWVSLKDEARFPPTDKMPLPTNVEAADPSLWTPWPALDLVTREGECCGCCGYENGAGRVRVREACPTCGGHKRPCRYCTGLPKGGPMPRAQRLDDRFVHVELDAKVRDLSGVRYRLVPNPSCKDARVESDVYVQFAFDGGCGLLVPLGKTAD